VRLGDHSLCECLFFLGHDPFTGKPLIRQDILDIGLAGAVIGDLLFDERIALEQATVVLTSRYATGDPIADQVLRLIMGEPAQHGVRDWVTHLSDKIMPTVTESLAARRVITSKQNRGLLRRSTQYPPTDLRTASAPRARIRTAMFGRANCDLATATLALLTWSLGVDDICAPELNRKQMTEWIDQVKSMIIEPIVSLVAGVDAAIAATVYGGNRG
jgi:Golgi phosphoprotein 3 GPP34